MDSHIQVDEQQFNKYVRNISGMQRDVTEWSRTCMDCQRAIIYRHNRLIPTKINIPDNRFDHVRIDIVVMPLTQGFSYCLTRIDRHSRWPKVIPLTEMSAQTVANAF